MQSQSAFFDDLARLMTGAMGMAQGLQDEAKTFLRVQADRMAQELDLVPREEFEAVKQMAADAKAEADALRARLEALEAQMNGSR